MNGNLRIIAAIVRKDLAILWPLVVIAAITLPVAVWLFRHRLV